MTDRAIKSAATRAEKRITYIHDWATPQNIYARCSDGLWVREVVDGRRHWRRWRRVTKIEEDQMFELNIFGKDIFFG